MLQAAKRLEPVDVDQSRATYLEALSAAIFAGRMATPGGCPGGRARSRCCAAAPAPRAPPTSCWTALAALYDGAIRQGCRCCSRLCPSPRYRHVRRGGIAAAAGWQTTTALRLWDADRRDTLSARHLQLTREVGALSELALALTSRALHLLFFARDLIAVETLIVDYNPRRSDRHPPSAVR